MGRQTTVVIPTLHRRKTLFEEAQRSVQRQTEPGVSIQKVVDHECRGGALTRNRGLEVVGTEWTAFLDDDDVLHNHHVQFLLDRAEEHDLDMAWPWFQVTGGTDPFPENRGRQLDPNDPHIFPITLLVRTELAQAALSFMGGFQYDHKNWGSWYIQDWPMWKDIIVRQRAKHMAFPDITWTWRHHGSNTSGLGADGLRLRESQRAAKRSV